MGRGETLELADILVINLVDSVRAEKAGTIFENWGGWFRAHIPLEITLVKGVHKIGRE